MGWVYVLANYSMPGVYKIGMTTRQDLSRRVSELSASTSVPTPFTVAFKFKTRSPLSLERAVHEALKRYRVNKKREFFSCPLWRIKREIRLCSGKSYFLIDWLLLLAFWAIVFWIFKK